MPESEFQLPPNSTGVQIRTELGDGTTQIPSGVMQEVITEADAVGILAGDYRQRALTVYSPTEDLILAELRRMNVLLLAIANQSLADPVEMPSLDDTILS